MGGYVNPKTFSVPAGRSKSRAVGMANSYICCYVHYIFSTKNRESFINSEIQSRLYEYIGGIAKENGMRSLSIGGTENHVHILLSLSATITIAKAVQLIKGGSSYWIHQTFGELKHFAWQDGYGAFAVSPSLIDKTVEYIQNQKKHHRVKTFEEEYIAFLEKFGVDYDKAYVFG